VSHGLLLIVAILSRAVRMHYMISVPLGTGNGDLVPLFPLENYPLYNSTVVITSGRISCISMVSANFCKTLFRGF
jgi:hypothetical protein